MRPSGVAKLADITTKSPCMKNNNDIHNRLVVAPFGAINFEMRKVRNAPVKKEPSETRVVSQAYGFAGRLDVESPRMTVFPV